MVNAQEWLDQNYPKERRYIKDRRLDLRNLNLEGDLNLKGFFSAGNDPLKVYLAGNPKLGKIEEKPDFAKLIYQNPQEWLNQQYSNKGQVEGISSKDLEFEQLGGLTIDNYPNLKTISGGVISNLTELTIDNCPQLEGINIQGKNIQQLTLHDLPSLRRLYCQWSNLTNLDLTTCPNLQIIICQGNDQLTEIKLPQEEKIEELCLNNNNFNQDLSFLGHLVNLKKLYLGNNKFTGSLEPLKNMSKLEILDISNTDIDSGLECLPKSIEKFYYSFDEGNNVRVKKIHQALKDKSIPERKKEWEKEMNDLLDRTESIKKDVNRLFGGYNQSEIKELKDPAQLEKYKNFFYWAKWAGRGVTVTSGILSLNDYPMLGGGIAVSYPFIEAVISEKEKELVESNENNWDRFVTDSKQLWNTYQELKETLEFLEVFYDNSSTEKVCNFIKQLEEELSKKKDEKSSKSANGENQGIKEIENEIKDLEKKITVEKAKPEAKRYKLWLLWKKIKEIIPEKENQQDNDLITKNQFAQDLWKNWTDKKNRGNNTIRGRKSQWKEVGEMLAEVSKEYQRLVDNQSRQKGKNVQKQTDHLVIDIDLTNLNENNVQRQTQAKIIQPERASSYGTFWFGKK